jgi:hypothetical protein
MVKSENTIVLIFSLVVFILLVILLVNAYNTKCRFSDIEKFTVKYDTSLPAEIPSIAEMSNKYADINKAGMGMDGIDGNDPLGNSVFNPVDASEERTYDNSTCMPRDNLTSKDLLPTDAQDSKWAQMNPSSNGSIFDGSYLNAAYHIGVSTVGSSLRNPNLQLRSEIPNPQNVVSPWQNSTISPDTNKRQLEIGS